MPVLPYLAYGHSSLPAMHESFNKVEIQVEVHPACHWHAVSYAPVLIFLACVSFVLQVQAVTRHSQPPSLSLITSPQQGARVEVALGRAYRRCRDVGVEAAVGGAVPCEPGAFAWDPVDGDLTAQVSHWLGVAMGFSPLFNAMYSTHNSTVQCSCCVSDFRSMEDVLPRCRYFL